jgi:hypothetical protein
MAVVGGGSQRRADLLPQLRGECGGRGWGAGAVAVGARGGEEHRQCRLGEELGLRGVSGIDCGGSLPSSTVRHRTGRGGKVGAEDHWRELVALRCPSRGRTATGDGEDRPWRISLTASPSG